MNMLIRFFIVMALLKREHAEQNKGKQQKAKNSVDSSASQNNVSADLFQPFSRSYRILPHDMGFRNHLPNYRYLSFIELNVTGWLYKILKKNQLGGLSMDWIISMQEMVYLKEIKFLNKMTVSSTLEGWDEKYVYFQHHFYVKNTLMAIGLTKFVLMNKEGKQSPAVLGMQGKHLTEVIKTWNANQTAIKSQ
ncbi:acyl-CoA thioesterase [Psychrobacter sanguinis]|uniref:acyl-CoA thioesterase n=1 Tax=Psychrobacter sanguinis TaxID=861445 RepID=UPI00191B324E|nr:acyl-CoA thioesterase [Psychrobacter sanguinis]MCC3308343.1 acyl-CoA thioesterase [Psychrobacter sanguinis]UEC25652.1 acyl-CoA thioesterase [Psychrobacter sanguinis]